MNRAILAVLMILILAVVGCSLKDSANPDPASIDQLQTSLDELPPGDAKRGEQIFIAQPCKTCHMDLGVGPVFPGDPPLAARGEARKPGYSLELYLYESLLEPNAYIVPGFQDDIMPDDAGRALTDQELADLIAYLMTMK